MKKGKCKLNKTVFLAIISILILNMLFNTVVFAAPALPHAFYGNVTINNDDASAGTTITAKINDVAKGSITVQASGAYGGENAQDSKLVVQPGENSDTIKFYVNDVYARSYSFSSGGITNLDLNVDISSDSSQTGTVSSDNDDDSYPQSEDENQLQIENTSKDEVEEIYGITLVKNFSATDQDGDGTIDSFTDPNEILTDERFVSINGNTTILISVDGILDDIFLWDTNANTISKVTHSTGSVTDTIMNSENETITMTVIVNKTDWIYIEITDTHPDSPSLTVETSEGRVISDDMIWRENNKIYVLDDPDTEYMFIYQYLILPPVFNPASGTTFNISRPTINITYFETLTLLEAVLNSESITNNLVSADNQIFTYTPETNLSNGIYTLSITVQDADNNIRGDISTYVVNTEVESSQIATYVVEIPWFLIIFALTLLSTLILVFYNRKLVFSTIKKVHAKSTDHERLMRKSERNKLRSVEQELKGIKKDLLFTTSESERKYVDKLKFKNEELMNQKLQIKQLQTDLEQKQQNIKSKDEKLQLWKSENDKKTNEINQIRNTLNSTYGKMEKRDKTIEQMTKKLANEKIHTYKQNNSLHEKESKIKHLITGNKGLKKARSDNIEHEIDHLINENKVAAKKNADISSEDEYKLYELLKIICSKDIVDSEIVLKKLNISMDGLGSLIDGLVEYELAEFISNDEVEITDKGVNYVKSKGRSL